MSCESRSYTARVIFPVVGPPIPGGVVAVRDGMIESVSARGRAADIDFGNAAIIPGLVNAHCHLDLSGASGLIPPSTPDRFTDWLRGVIAFRRSRTAELVAADIRRGIAECLRFGTTLIGDISADGACWDALKAVAIRSVVFREVIGLTPERGAEAVRQLRHWQDSRIATDRVRPGVSPHAPYSVGRSVVAAAIRSHLPLAMHWLESAAEVQFLDEGSGPFVEFLAGLGVLDMGELGTREDLFADWSEAAARVLLVHANHQRSDVNWPARVHVVYCPRTHAAFAHPRHPVREFLDRGVSVCLGTDSLASNPDLDVLAEVRFLHRVRPDLRGADLLRMATLAGAEALGWADTTGSLEPGKSADFVAVPLPDTEADDPHDLLFTDVPGERVTVFHGEFRQG